jgi:hypothetical protein
MKKTPELLDKITDVVLAYRPTPKSKGGKKRVRKAKKAKGIIYLTPFVMMSDLDASHRHSLVSGMTKSVDVRK